MHVLGVQSEVAALASTLGPLLTDVSAPGRRPKVTTCLSCSSPEERRAAVRAARAVLLVLSPSVWSDTGCMEDLRTARQLGKQVVLLQVRLGSTRAYLGSSA